MSCVDKWLKEIHGYCFLQYVLLGPLSEFFILFIYKILTAYVALFCFGAGAAQGVPALPRRRL